MPLKPKKSLRSIFILWLILFSVVPLGFVTFYSIKKFETAINQELTQRLSGNIRELEVIFSEIENNLRSKHQLHKSDKKLIYYLANNKISDVRDLSSEWIRAHFIQRLSVFNLDGRLEVALFRDSKGDVVRNHNHESTDVYLSDQFVKQFRESSEDTQLLVDFKNSQRLDLIIFSKILSASGTVVGYLEEIVEVDDGFLASLKNRLNLELVFSDKEGKATVSSHEDLEAYRAGFFVEKVMGDIEESPVFDLNIRGVPFGFTVKRMPWGQSSFYLTIGASKHAVEKVMANVNYAFFTIVGAIIVLLVLLSLVISKIVLRPVSDLLSALSNMDGEAGPVDIPVTSDNELGLLTESFNSMSNRVYRAQIQLKENIKELENANKQIQSAQSQLIHSAKMASLGQLVAGVAHELNNPISFIYSNIVHLRDYTQKLHKIIGAPSIEKQSKLKAEVEYDYITEDLPKLIDSCEEGARRTKDIVIGLRNFSRLDEAKLHETDIKESLETTLSLLKSEIGSDIEIVRQYIDIPSIQAYSGQLNQVFMNILSNACHAIEGKGVITVGTKKISDKQIAIRIHDTGKGMNQEDQDKIFDPFFTTKAVGSGTGLGMSITYGIVQKHKGEIKLSSELGKGTEFTILLPVSQ